MIQFPKLHIATSALNRIQNALEDMDEGGPVAVPELQIPPTLPGANTAALGEMIEAGAEPRQAPVELPEDPERASVVEAGVSGGSPLDGLLGGAFG